MNGAAYVLTTYNNHEHSGWHAKCVARVVRIRVFSSKPRLLVCVCDRLICWWSLCAIHSRQQKKKKNYFGDCRSLLFCKEIPIGFEKLFCTWTTSVLFQGNVGRGRGGNPLGCMRGVKTKKRPLLFCLCAVVDNRCGSGGRLEASVCVC